MRQEEREKLEDLLARATGKLCLNVPPWKAHANSNDWGTFVFFRQDMALTADHNLRDGSGRTRFTGYYKKGEEIEFEWLQAWSCEKLDIAVLRLVNQPPDLLIESVPVAYLDPDMSLRARKIFWAGRELIIFGYPFRGKGSHGWRIDGSVDTALPIIPADQKTRGGHGNTIEFEVDYLNVVGSRIKKLEGISGAGMVAAEFDSVIAIEHRYDPKERQVLGTELGLFIARFPPLKQYFQPLFPSIERPAKGVVALARRRDEPDPAVVPISVLLFPSEQFTGEMIQENSPLASEARSAAAWAGDYLLRCGPELERIIEHRRFSGAMFRLPDAAWESSARPALHAGMVLALIARLLGDLVREMELPSEFPASLFLCGAGFLADGLVQGEERIEEALFSCPFPEPVTLFFSKDQQSLIAKLTHLPAHVVPWKVDQPVDMVRRLLDEFLRQSRTPEVERHLKDSFAAMLDELHRLEKDLRDAAWAAALPGSRLHELDNEIELHLRQEQFLRSKNEEVKAIQAEGKPGPLPSAVVDEFIRNVEQWRRDIDSPGEDQAEITLFVLTAGSEQEAWDRHLWRRLIRLCAPDMQRPESQWIHNLIEHREDMLYLRSLEGALIPFGDSPRPAQAEHEVAQWIGRLRSLRETRARLKEKLRTLREQLQIHQGWQSRLDDEFRDKKAALTIVQESVDQLWRELSWRLGPDPVQRSEGAHG